MADDALVGEFSGEINKPRLNPDIIPFAAPPGWRSVGELARLILDRLSVESEEVER
jgi:hypothetical protein